MRSFSQREILLLNLFALSGVAALIYQICWQRMLFTAFGVDIESITIIVSVFMLGLGLGALLGGFLADRFPHKILTLFKLTEFIIGVFGLSSPFLISRTADYFILAGALGTGIVNFCLLLFPTIMMGATLPMLVVYLHQTLKHVGISIGKLYFVNTLGASLGSFLVGFVLFYFFTLNGAIYFAACLNFLVAALVTLTLEKWEHA